jgi:glutaminyl-peptide cyclotransferase
MFAVVACAKQPMSKPASIAPLPPTVASSQPAPVARYTYEIIRTFPHDRAAFTQGLVFRNGGFVESTGLNGRSTLREVDLETGRVSKQVAVPAEFFAEGLAVLGAQAFQLTWRSGQGFVYDVDTFRLERKFTYTGEGWGLTTDGRVLIMSDGTNRLRFFDPATLRETRSVAIFAEGKPVDQLNELEWINGEIFANVWQTDTIVRIDPATGQVRGTIDFSGLLDAADRRPDTDVLNGIAYDAASDRLFITGKLWPKVFEVRVIPRR